MPWNKNGVVLQVVIKDDVVVSIDLQQLVIEHVQKHAACAYVFI